MALVIATPEGGAALLMIVALFGVCFGATYKVGDSAGRTIDGVDYNKWASAKKFLVGDTLVFNYDTQYHNVLQLTKDAYESCNLKSSMTTFSSGSDSITLRKAGHSYFVSGFPGHCQAGLKLDIPVSVSSPSSQSSNVPIIHIPLPQASSNCKKPPSSSPNVPVPPPPGLPNNFSPPSGPAGSPSEPEPQSPPFKCPPFKSAESDYSPRLSGTLIFLILLFSFLLTN